MQTTPEARNLGGRPALPDELRMVSIGAVRLRPAVLAEIDAIVQADRAGTDRSSVIRALLVEALEARRGRARR